MTRCVTCGEVLESKNYAVENAGNSGINVNWHSQEDIIEYLSEHPIDTISAVTFDEKPTLSGNLTVSSFGSVSTESLNTAITALNSIRYIAGIDDNITLDETYTEYAQGASLISAYYNALSHYPSQPESMDDETYNICYIGASSSNLGAGHYNIVDSLLGYMSDSQTSNIATVGHRRWILNPGMSKTGFGFVATTTGYRYYSAMYAFGESYVGESYYGVAWPAQNMPVEYFAANDPWSISMGQTIDISAVEVTLTRISDGKTWTFSENSSDGYFNVNNGNYGRKGCIIFRPNNITYSNGDQFVVNITGFSKENISYQVNFFSI